MNIKDKPKWIVMSRDEQETIINVDYYEKKLSLYTSRKSVAERLRKKVGEPSHTYTQDGLISGVTYDRDLHDKDIKAFFSISTIIGGFRQNNYEDDKLVEEAENNSTD